ncbi:MAG: molybdopterin-dependent oxidoreductase [Rubrimonas sp.]|uniref:molybdopterin-containing oxidoreductase family protein n=1 Tax=Rubrimonas sp. TaxID=2036015 RepID=UPI002FDD61BA
MKRREFLKITTAIGATAVVPGLLAGCSDRPLPGEGEVSAAPFTCNMCFWACAGMGYTENGKPWKLVGNDDDTHCRGRLCVRGTGGIASYTDPDRLKTPLLRVEENGVQSFKPVSWDEALQFIADRMAAIKEKHGGDRIAYMKHGSGGDIFRPLLHAYGSHAEAHPSHAQCRGPREVGWVLTYGANLGSPEPTDMENSKCIVLIGSHLGENMHNAQVQDWIHALENGCKLIVVDPRFSVAAGKADHWLPIKPGTDIALMLAWMHVLIFERRYNVEFVAQNCEGFEALANHVKDFNPEWAFLETGIRPEVIRATARQMGAAAPATMIHPGRHVTWYGDDVQRTRCIAILNALLGSWGAEGGFFQAENVKMPSFPIPEIPKPEQDWRQIVQAEFPLAGGGLTNKIIEHSVGPDAHFKGWFIYATNLPMTIPGAREQLRHAAESLDLIVVIDTLPVEMTELADVVLPECTYLERYEPLRNQPERIPTLAVNVPVYEPLYDSKPSWWMAKQLAEKMGLGEYYPFEDFSEVIDWQLQQVGSSLEEMKRIGVKRFERQTPKYAAAGERSFGTPSGKIELSSSLLAQFGHDPLPKYVKHAQPPEGFFWLNYGRTAQHTFGRSINNPLLFELMPENAVWVNPIVAREKGLKSGDYVLLRNPDGIVSNRVRVRVTERIRPDSVYIVHGFGHNAKGLTLAHQRGADDSMLQTNVPIDPIMGATAMRLNYVTIIAEEAAA